MYVVYVSISRPMLPLERGKYNSKCKLSNRKMMSMHIHEFTRLDKEP